MRGVSFQVLLSSILEVPLVEICQDKNQSSSTRQELHVGTRNKGFRQIFKRRVREIVGFEVFGTSEGFFYAPRGRNSSYFGLFPF